MPKNAATLKWGFFGYRKTYVDLREKHDIFIDDRNILFSLKTMAIEQNKLRGSKLHCSMQYYSTQVH